MILVLGGAGYMASQWAAFFRREGVEHRLVSRGEFDYSSRKGLHDLIVATRPRFLINAAGYTGIPNVDASESKRATCLLANTALPSLLMHVCAEHGLRWAHLSTGCIYSGNPPHGRGYNETDPPNFTFRQNRCSFYSGTKALAEEILLQNPDIWIWRFRRPFNHIAHPRNYLTKVIGYPKHIKTENSITFLDEFLAAGWQCMREGFPGGIYHMTNPGILKTTELMDLLHRTGVSEQAYHFYNSEEEFYTEANRTPRSECVLDSSKIRQLGVSLTEVHEALETCLRHWNSDPKADS
ncbi:MAG: sugar nucleotide-binding protein [Candidatus Methylacidiphilales bacterium]